MADHPFMPLIQAYVIATITYLLIQLSLAIANWRLQVHQRPEHMRIVNDLLRRGEFPPVTVIYPIYNEDPDILDAVMACAAACLDIPRLEVVFVDDGSPNRDAIEPIYRKYEAQDTTGRLRILREPENRGKREALYRGFQVANGEYIITADSDTFIEGEDILELVAPIVADSRIGAVTGDVRVENYADTWLTRLIALRYWVSFHVERGAQSYTGSMMVCSGPFTVYRADVIHHVADDFMSQTFLGRPCSYGDDRHLTWLVLRQGYLTRIQEGAIARTMAPRTLREYVPQQVRWTKSFIRELFWVLPEVYRISPYAMLDTLYQPIISFCFMFALSNVMFLFLETWNPYILLGEFVILLLMASLRGLYGLARTGWADFVRFPLYGVLHVLIILPLRWKALFTLRDVGWGTRLTRKINEFRSFLCWQAFFFGTVLVLAFGASQIVSEETVANMGSLHVYNFFELAEHFLRVVSYWWFRALLLALTLVPLFIILGARTQGIALENVTPAYPLVYLKRTAKNALQGLLFVIRAYIL